MTTPNQPPTEDKTEDAPKPGADAATAWQVQVQAQDHADAAPPAPGWFRAKVWPPLRSVVTTLGLFAVAFVAMTSLVGGPLAEGQAVALRGVDLQGQPFDSASLRGKTTVIYLWATWCPACKATTPSVDLFASLHPDVNVLAVAAEEPPPVLAAIAANPRSFRTVADDGALAAALGISSLPTTIVLDEQGNVRWNRQGVLLPFELDFRAR